jgi:S1-C subfamily serine protease
VHDETNETGVNDATSNDATSNQPLEALAAAAGDEASFTDTQQIEQQAPAAGSQPAEPALAADSHGVDDAPQKASDAGSQVPPWYTWPATPVAEPSQMKPKRRMWAIPVAIVVAAALIGGGLALGLSNTGTAAASKGSPITFIQSTEGAPASSAAQMIKRVLPSVVNIRVTEISSNPFGGSQTGQAEGSGVVLSKDGLIVTNAHVVSQASSVKVVFTNGHPPLDGTVLGIDTDHDLAVVKVNATDLQPITVGHSGSLQLVDDVYAIGFPLDLGPSVTRGVISGLNRTVNVSRPDGSTEHLVGMLQTDAAINPGNSGGALIDSSGALIGINTAGASAGEAENVGFAIAIDGAIPIVQRLSQQTPSQRAWMGVSVTPVSDDAAAQQFGVPAGTRGAGIADVVSSGPADSAGLKTGEVIVSIDGKTIATTNDLTNALKTHKPGDRISVSVVSSSGQRTVTLTLGTRPPGLP